MARANILIVEDECIVSLDIKRTLERLGYTVDAVVISGEAAVQQAAVKQPDLVLMDIKLSGAMDGIEAAEQIRDRFDTPVVYLTAYADDATLQRAKVSEPFGYLLKPFEERVLHSTIEMALFKHKMESRLKKSEEKYRLLYAVNQQRLDELTTLNEISHAVNSSLDLQETLTLITDRATRLLGMDASSVVLWDQARKDLWFAAASGEGAEFVLGKRLAMGQGIVGQVVQDGEPALVPDVSQDPRFFDSFDEKSGFTTRSVLCAPLQIQGRTIGAIEAINNEGVAFDQEDLALLTSLAAPAATAIENARLFEAEKSARRTAETLRAANLAFTQTLDLDVVLEALLDYLGQFVSYDRAQVVLVDENSCVVERAARGYEDCADIEHHSAKQHACSLLRVPLVASGQFIGLCSLEKRQAGFFTEEHQRLAESLITQAAIAIQNARLYQQVRVGRERLQTLSRRLVEIQESERRHIARELHDQAGQALSSLMVDLRLLEEVADDGTEVAAHIADLKHTVDSVSAGLHQLATDLRPASLDHLGMGAALRQFAGRFSSQHDLIVQFEMVGLEDERLSPMVETAIYRIVQEALTNVVRHAAASRADVLLERQGDRVITIVEDDGVGFDLAAAMQSGRLGLVGVQERAEMLGGSLVVESTPGAGTTLFVEVPYAHSFTDC